MRLKDKVAIVTGAAQGIGLACAEAFVAEGAQVVLADRDAVKGRQAADRLGKACRFFACDVANAKDVQALIAETVKAFSGLDILVNNAGILHAADFLELAEEDFDRVLAVNLKAPFVLGQAAARHMVRSKTAGCIINMSSINAVLAIPSLTPYVVAKGGLNQLTKVMALALAPYGIRVNGIGPGSIATELLQATMTEAAARNRILSRTPLGRVGEPKEIASVAVFLATSESSYMTGQTVYVDGGRLALNYTVPVAETQGNEADSQARHPGRPSPDE